MAGTLRDRRFTTNNATNDNDFAIHPFLVAPLRLAKQIDNHQNYAAQKRISSATTNSAPTQVGVMAHQTDLHK